MKWWAAIGLLLLASALVWERDRNKAAADANAKADDFAALALAPRMLPRPNEELDVFDVVMRPTNTISTRADQRPFYMVLGRIKNRTMFPVDEVWLNIEVYDSTTGETADSAVVKLEDLGLRGDDTVTSFSRTVQLLPPSKWGFRYDIIQAKSDPEPSDTNFDIGLQSSK